MVDPVQQHEIPQHVADRGRLIAHEFDRPIEILGSKFLHPRSRIAMNALESWRSSSIFRGGSRPGGRASRGDPPRSILKLPYASASARCQASSPMERPSGSGRKSYPSRGNDSSNLIVFAISRSHTSSKFSSSVFIDWLLL